jgi:hypothetical protein
MTDYILSRSRRRTFAINMVKYGGKIIMSKNKKPFRGKSDGSRPGAKIAPELMSELVKSAKEVRDWSSAPNEYRLSDWIVKLIEPYIGKTDFTLLADCAAVAWNECLREDFGVTGPYALNNIALNYARYRELIDELKARKRAMFKDNQRPIREIKVYDRGGGNMSINVVSDLAPGEVYRPRNEEYEAHSDADDAEFYAAMRNGGSGVAEPNPFLKHTLLAVINKQLRDNDPPEARNTYERLQSAGYTPEQAKNMIAAVFIEDVVTAISTQTPHNEAEYKKRLQALK